MKEEKNDHGWTPSLDSWTMAMQEGGYSQWEIAAMLRRWVEASDAAIGTEPYGFPDDDP